MNRGCPICKCHIVEGLPVEWELVCDGKASTFSVDVCKLDHVLCEVFPTLKAALGRSEVVSEMLRRAYG